MDPSLTGLGDILIGSLLAVIGLASMALSLVRRQGADPLLASFGAFTSLYGIRLIFNSPLTSALGVPPATSVWISSLVTYVILVPAWYFFWQLLGDGWHRLSFWWVRIVAVFAGVGIASDLVRSTPGTLGQINNVLVILGLAVVVLGFWSRRHRMTPDLRILLAGLFVFGLFALNDNLVPLGIVPWSWRNETLGFMFFMGCLGWIAARGFVATERELAGVEGELQAAKRIQSSILPSSSPRLDGLVVASRFEPSSAVAGDLFDFLTPRAQQLGIVIADVSGHGVPAALIASMVKVAVESRAESASRPAELLTQVNQTLCGSFQHGFVSAAYMFLDMERCEAIVASGGHPYPLLKRRSEDSAREIGGAGVVLGRFPEAAFEQEHLLLEPGDRLVLYTDGIVEARAADNEIFGEERLKSLVSASGSQSAEEFCDGLMDELGRWVGGPSEAPHDDDLTLVVVDFLPKETSGD